VIYLTVDFLCDRRITSRTGEQRFTGSAVHLFRPHSLVVCSEDSIFLSYNGSKQWYIA
jgi:hypothetical protein